MRMTGTIAFVATLLAASQVMAAEAAYVGTWGTSQAHCKVPQDRQGAPLVFSPQGYDQHEAHCAFKSVRPTGAGRWAVVAECSVEGDKQKDAFSLNVVGSKLTMIQGRSTRTYMRCR